MAMNIGQGSRIQAGLETTWGTPVAGTNNITHKSESLKYVAEKKTEESLVGGRAPRGMQTTASKVEGDVNFAVKPDEIGFLVALALGDEVGTAQEDASSAYRHTFEPLLTGSAPKATLHINRKVAIAKYTSCKVDSLKLSAGAGEFLDGTISLRGYDEDFTGAIDSGVIASVLKGFRFADAAVSLNAADLGGLVKSINVEISNNLESDNQVLASGTKNGELEWQNVSVNVSFELLYDSQGQALHASQFKQDTNVSLEITFSSPEEVEAGYPYELTIKVPVAQIEDSTFNLADAGRIKHSMSFAGQEDNSNAVITMEVVDAKDTAYLA